MMSPPMMSPHMMSPPMMSPQNIESPMNSLAMSEQVGGNKSTRKYQYKIKKNPIKSKKYK